MHYEGVGTLGNLVHSSPNIKRSVLEQGALEPVIDLLHSTCSNSRREAALLLGQFAQSNPRVFGKQKGENKVTPCHVPFISVC